ncbi:MAG: dienelactone hydrolase family protein [Holosporaceae bacterium]|nr:MAG: dienelactone hydrolase family protein [Holosporaceae bacterium]
MPIQKSNIGNYNLISSCVGQPKHLVLILHGYGANSQNLLFMAHFWKQSINNCLFIIPDAPEPMTEVDGFKWFEVGDLTPTYLDKGVEKVAPDIQRFLTKLQNAYSIPPEETAICGFSQGAMLALATGLLFKDTCKGIIAYSGGLYLGQHAPKNMQVSSCLIHGERDLVVPKEASEEAYTYLRKQRFSTELHIFPHLEHQINLAGLQRGEHYLKQLF